MNLIANSCLKKPNKKGEPFLIRLFYYLLITLYLRLTAYDLRLTTYDFILSYPYQVYETPFKNKGVELHRALIMLVTQWLFSLDYDSKDSMEFVTNSIIGNLMYWGN